MTRSLTWSGRLCECGSSRRAPWSDWWRVSPRTMESSSPPTSTCSSPRTGPSPPPSRSSRFSSTGTSS
ncbi:unnamed protein product [Timema podura]|uniref:Uncharacterized protein n=1 Tax=Timema podura TaxID=61482 RepID=A0ABN7PRI4_TIMPD|nr:unnamed protein product [Timema podura]